jgi:hypothetical protein
MVASLDRKRLGADFCGGAGYRTEAFSIRRLGGSRWRSRRTRCAMGFERQRGSEQGLGRAARRGGNAVRIVGMVLKMSESVCARKAGIPCDATVSESPAARSSTPASSQTIATRAPMRSAQRPSVGAASLRAPGRKPTVFAGTGSRRPESCENARLRSGIGEAQRAALKWSRQVASKENVETWQTGFYRQLGRNNDRKSSKTRKAHAYG